MTETAAQSERYTRGPWREAGRRLLRNRAAVVSGVVLAVLLVLAVVGPWASPYPYQKQDLAHGAQSPSSGHWLGTDDLGRDLLTRLLYGARISLAVGVVATLVSVAIGISYGAIAGFFGGRVDNTMMRIVDVLYGLPYIFFVIILVIVTRDEDLTPARNLLNLFIALGAVQWLTMSRITRGQVLSLRKMPYVEAARASGAGSLRVIFRHIVPNLLGPVIVYATLNVPVVMLQEAFLSYLGLGVMEPMPSWGTLIFDGTQAMLVSPWLIIFPGVAFTVTLLALNFLGDGLRDALDPQMRKE